MNSETLSKYAPQALAVLRIVTALTYMAHGTQKLFGFPASQMPGGVELLSLFGVSGILEVFGGLAILLGLFTRPVAFVLAGEMAVAYFQFHAPKGWWAVQNGGVSAALSSDVRISDATKMT